MRHTLPKLAAACAVALSLAACNTPGDRALGGAGIGGLAGAGIGGLAGGGRGALIGGLAGAATGAVVGAATTPQPVGYGGPRPYYGGGYGAPTYRETPPAYADGYYDRPVRRGYDGYGYPAY